MAHRIFTEVIASISELEQDPMATVDSGEGCPVAILNRNEPVFYCVPADVYEAMLDRLDDQELASIVTKRFSEPSIKVDLNDLV